MSDTTILVEGHEVTADTLPKMPLRTFNLLLAHGWDAKAGYSRFREAVIEYGPKAAKAGETRGGAEVDMHWIQAYRGHDYLDAVWHDGSFLNARYNRALVKSTELNRIIKEES